VIHKQTRPNASTGYIPTMVCPHPYGIISKSNDAKSKCQGTLVEYRCPSVLASYLKKICAYGGAPWCPILEASTQNKTIQGNCLIAYTIHPY